MMKSKDCAVATALVIHGYLRANEAEVASPTHLEDAIRAIRGECDDWAENLSSNEAAHDPQAISLGLFEANGGSVSRSPYNLISAALALISEAVDLSGPDAVADLQKRLQQPVTRKPPSQPVPPHQRIDVLIDAANELASHIDAATERPESLLAAWTLVCIDLRSRGVVVEERCNAPANW